MDDIQEKITDSTLYIKTEMPFIYALLRNFFINIGNNVAAMKSQNSAS